MRSYDWFLHLVYDATSVLSSNRTTYMTSLTVDHATRYLLRVWRCLGYLGSLW